ncbi:DUT nucleotidohydrolase, partial [Casuarius casuarius]|nr:DUT nucleotidohydrolase [Casuarius casuarius]
SGSAGVDVATAIDVMLTTGDIQLVSSTLKGPLGYGLSALLLGRPSTSRQGIFVLPGVIDADYTGVIKIMLYTLAPPVSIPKGSKIAQLVPFQSQVPYALAVARGEGGFGSTGQPQVLFALDIQRSKPEELVEIRHPSGGKLMLEMIIDTGADVTIIP